MGIVWDDETPTSKGTFSTIHWDDGEKELVPSSALGAFGRAAARSAIPTAAGLGAGAAGYALGAELAPATGGLSLAIPVAASLVAGLGGQAAGSAGQNAALRTFLPKLLKRLNRQQAADVQEHPLATMAGQLAPSAIALRPSVSAPLSMKMIGGGLGAGMEAVGEAARHEPLNPAKIAMSGTAGAFLNKPTALGRALGFPAATETEIAPTEAAPSVERPADTQERVQRVIGALNEAEPVRGKQERLYTEERGKRLARAAGVREQIGGEKGYYAELGQLKGELPKAHYESIRSKLQQADIDGLFDDINRSGLDFWDSLPAKGGLTKMLEGQVPTRGELRMLKSVFGSELTETLQSKRPFFDKAKNFGIEMLNLPRTLTASLGDFSASLRQAAFIAPRYPVKWTKAFLGQFKQFASEKAFQAAQQEISSRPTYPLMRQHQLALTEVGGELSQQEERFMAEGLAEKIPLVGKAVLATNRAYVGMLNRLRADVFDDFVKAGRDAGITDPTYLDHAANFVNAGTGRGSLRVPLIGGVKGSEALERSAVLFNSTFFSPRLMASRLNLLDPTYYMRLQPSVRKEALKSLFAFAGTGASLLAILKMNGVEVGVDPRSADFGKLKVGNTRYDIWGGFQQPIRAAAQLITGKQISSTTGREITLGEGYRPTTRMDILGRYFKSKEAPVASFISDWLTGTTFSGEKFQLAPEILDRFIPMTLQDMHDIAQEEGAASWWKASPTVFGVGVQTYGSQIPMRTATPGGKPTISFRQPPSLGEELANRFTGTKVSNIPSELHPALRQAREDKLMHQMDVDKAKRKVLETGEPAQVDNTMIYLKDGVIMTKTLGRAETPERAFEQLTEPAAMRNRLVERYREDGVVRALKAATNNDQKVDILRREQSQFSSPEAFDSYLNDLRLRNPGLVSRDVRMKLKKQ